MRTKEDFHKLIDRINDEEALKGYCNLIQRLNENHTGELWEGLSSEEKEELMLSYKERFDPAQLLPHKWVKKQHDKWLKR
jgi:hypothetical protein